MYTTEQTVVIAYFAISFCFVGENYVTYHSDQYELRASSKSAQGRYAQSECFTPRKLAQVRPNC